MALVILPCDLPHWFNVQKQLSSLSSATNAKQLVDGMLKIYDLCNISTGLDPDEPETADPEMFAQLETFLMTLSNGENIEFYSRILPAMIRRALDLKKEKPSNGFHFSLQQQGDERAYRRSFLASLLAHSFFSTFPKRTEKTHPTLQDFNFNFFFKFLDKPCQQAKLKSIFHYFELLERAVINENEMVTYSRQVMTGKQWLTINDWIENCSPLCPIAVRNDGSIDDVEPQCFRICFSSAKIGGSVLCEGKSQESIDFSTIPELICILASVEALEDNEVFLVNDACQVSKIGHPKHKANLEKFECPIRINLCCMDAENYSLIPLSQLEEDNVLRELNKALLGFRQGKSLDAKVRVNPKSGVQRRLSPIGESFSSTPRENHLSKEKINESRSSSSPEVQDSGRRRNFWLKPPGAISRKDGGGVEARRGRFIVLGSSGECLPVNRGFFPIKRESRKASVDRSDQGIRISPSRSDDDDDEIFHSARTSVDDEKDDVFKDANNEGNRTSSSEEDMISFTERLREALLRGARTYSTKTDDSSYAVDISVSGSVDEDNNVRCKRGTSTGFILQEESLDDGFYQESLEKDLNHVSNDSDDYSFTTDDSDLDVYDQLSKWIMTGSKDSDANFMRGEITSDFASNLLKRALSDGCTGADDCFQKKKRAVFLARSFSLELAKQNPKLAAQLVCLLSRKGLTLESFLPNKNGQKPVATGNWGCGSRLSGDPQIKLTIQWLAASYTGLPHLIYCTYRHQKLVKLDTVRRVLLDRRWTVGQLATLLLEYAETSLQNGHQATTLFDLLITSVHD